MFFWICITGKTIFHWPSPVVPEEMVTQWVYKSDLGLTSYLNNVCKLSE